VILIDLKANAFLIELPLMSLLHDLLIMGKVISRTGKRSIS